MPRERLKRNEQRVYLTDEEADFLRKLKEREGLTYTAEALRFCIREQRRRIADRDRRKTGT